MASAIPLKDRPVDVPDFEHMGRHGKRCSRCKQCKPFHREDGTPNFHKARHTTDGHHPYCRQCRSTGKDHGGAREGAGRPPVKLLGSGVVIRPGAGVSVPEAGASPLVAELAGRLLALLREAGAEGLTRTEMAARLPRQVSGAELGTALSGLERAGSARAGLVGLAGRQYERWVAVSELEPAPAYTVLKEWPGEPAPAPAPAPAAREEEAVELVEPARSTMGRIALGEYMALEEAPSVWIGPAGVSVMASPGAGGVEYAVLTPHGDGPPFRTDREQAHYIAGLLADKHAARPGVALEGVMVYGGGKRS
jgi:hypothetical protein